MTAPDTTAGGLPASAIMDAPRGPRRRWRIVLRRMAEALRDHAGTGAFLAMLTVCVALVALSR
jgi:hypothetical protein